MFMGWASGQICASWFFSVTGKFMSYYSTDNTEWNIAQNYVLMLNVASFDATFFIKHKKIVLIIQIFRYHLLKLNHFKISNVKFNSCDITNFRDTYARCPIAKLYAIIVRLRKFSSEKTNVFSIYYMNQLNLDSFIKHDKSDPSEN